MCEGGGYSFTPLTGLPFLGASLIFFYLSYRAYRRFSDTRKSVFIISIISYLVLGLSLFALAAVAGFSSSKFC